MDVLGVGGVVGVQRMRWTLATSDWTEVSVTHCMPLLCHSKFVP